MLNLEAAIRHLEQEISRRFGDKPLARHIRSVAEFAGQIAESAGGDHSLPRKAYLAALAHDLYKKHSPEELRIFLRAESAPVDSDSWRIGGGLLHAPAAAHYLHARLGLVDPDILAAVYYHTTGRPGASTLEKILFCADYLDPSRQVRDADPDVAPLSQKALVDLDEVYREILKRKLIHTLGKGRPVHPDAIAAWNLTCRQAPRVF